MSTTTLRPTPETDAAIIAANGTWTFELKEAMQKLERERDKAREELQQWKMLCAWGGTPEHIDQFIKGQQSRIHQAQDIEETCQQLERELNEARDQLKAMERAGAEQARRADENREWALRAEREAQEPLKHTLDELYEEQQKHGITKAHLTECQMQIKAMREAIKEGYDALTGCVDDSGELLAERGWWRDEPRCGYQARYEETKQRIEDAEAALTKLKLFIKP